MRQQSAFVRVVPQEHFVQPVLSHRPTVAQERLVPKPGNLTFRPVKAVQLVFSVKDKVCSFPQCALLDLTQMKRHLQSAHFVQQELTAARMRQSSSRFVKSALRVPIAL